MLCKGAFFGNTQASVYILLWYQNKKGAVIMAYEDKSKTTGTSHSVQLEGRNKLKITGVADIDNFDESEIVIRTSQGVLTVDGNEMHIEKLSLDTGDVVVNGLVYGLKYDDIPAGGKGFFGRLFGQ